MKRLLKAAAVCATVFFVSASDSGAAWDFSFLRTKAPALKTEADIAEGAKPAATDAANRNDKASGIGYTEFDGFNNVEDPLYREGTKAFLQKAIEADKVKAVSKDFPPRPAAMRDAPASIPAKSVQPVQDRSTEEEKVLVPPFKKNRLIKMVPADPLKEKSIL